MTRLAGEKTHTLLLLPVLESEPRSSRRDPPYPRRQRSALSLHSVVVVFFVLSFECFFFCFVSSFREVDHGDPLVHTPALVAEAMHFPQCLVLP